MSLTIFRTISKILIVLLASMFITLPSMADEGLNDKSSLAGLNSVKAIFDITTGNPKKLNFYLKLINDTAKSLQAQGVAPKFVLAFRGPATFYSSDNRDNIKVENIEVADQISEKLTMLNKNSSISLEQCGIAAKALKVDLKTFHPGVTVVGNSWISLIGYQSKGYSLVPVR